MSYLFIYPIKNTLNTVDKALAESYIIDGWEKIGEVDVVPLGTKIDLLTVDVEGEDLAVLRSGDWEKYRPDVIIIEALSTPLMMLSNHPAVQFLTERGYEARFRLFNSIVFSKLVA
ncbi:hypothetical protein CCP2SC5_440028 [Azospirillaceae bacterium]